MPEDSSNIQRAGAITYYLLLRWMAGAESITTSQVAEHLETDYATAWSLMEDLRPLPFLTTVEGYHSASLDLPLWKLRPAAVPNEACRAAMLTYALCTMTMCGMGLMAAQLRSFLCIKRTALCNLLDHLSASGCSIPLYLDGQQWKVATQQWVIARKHDLLQT